MARTAVWRGALVGSLPSLLAAAPLVAALLVGVLLAAVLLVAVRAAPPAAADGVGSGALTLSVTVNGLPGRGAERPGIRVGHPVVKRYVVTNRSGTDLHRVTVTDPAAPGRALTCPGGPRFWMRGMTSVVCTSRVPAAPGRHTTTARVRGDIPSLGLRPTATATAGYRGVGGALALTVTVTARNGPTPSAVLRYEVANPGDVPVYGARLTDPALPPGTRLDCAGRPAPPAALAPGARAVCAARLPSLRPGPYRSTPVVRAPPGSRRSARPGAGRAAGAHVAGRVRRAGAAR
ncbi:hypothetical protein, partial [Streptomyces thermolilacinus]|uniref:hypothetical protein n=1 Tax=Streptomyces thermolilacinus TaxID=285540 RepID=UPI0034931E02